MYVEYCLDWMVFLTKIWRPLLTDLRNIIVAWIGLIYGS